jgi:hypothetical protein
MQRVLGSEPNRLRKSGKEGTELLEYTLRQGLKVLSGQGRPSFAATVPASTTGTATAVTTRTANFYNPK